MSKVSLKTEMLPSFEPIEQQKASTQRRKRSLRDTSSNNKDQASHKRPRVKKNCTASTPSVAIAKSVVWIGATLMQQEKHTDIKNEEVPSSTAAAYSVYYGLNDGRNFTEKITIKQTQNLDHVYIMGAIRALEKCEDDTVALSIHTGSEILQSVINQDVEYDSAICDEIKERIAKRKGSTSVSYKPNSNTSNNEDEYQVAHKMATEKLLEPEHIQDDPMIIDDKEVNVLESLEVANNGNSDNEEILITTTTSEETNVEEEFKVAEKTVITKEITGSSSEPIAPLEPAAAPSWASTLNLRNLLDILKAPFTRKS